MNERELDALLDENLPEEELARLRRVDALLRSVPGPPAEVPRSLGIAVERIGLGRPRWSRRRLALAAALAVACAALAFGVGRWTETSDPEYTTVVTMSATSAAPGASAQIRLGGRDDASGNWKLELDVSGLPPLSGDRYYVLWLAKDGEYAGTCGTFNVRSGETKIEMTASYRLRQFDAWVISEHGESAPPLLTAKI